MEERKVFSRPCYDENGVFVLTEEEKGPFAHAMMDIVSYKMKAGESRTFASETKETAVLLIQGAITLEWEQQKAVGTRSAWYEEDLTCLHVCRATPITVTAQADSEILVQQTTNDRTFPAKLYRAEDCMINMSGEGLCGNTAVRRVVTVFDYQSAPYSNMVLGEVMSNQGNWSAYLPHSHPQPEVYFYHFDRPEGFGAAFVGEEAFKSVDGSFTAIPGGCTHPQVTAPGYRMYTCWMIRHFDGNPWTDRIDDQRYTWLYDAKF